MHYPLEPDADGMAALADAVLARAIAFVAGLADRPATGVLPDADGAALVSELLAAPPEQPGDLGPLLDRLDRATAHAFETAGPGYLAYIPGGGLFAAAVVELYTRVTNRYVGLAGPAPALTAIEESVVRWLARVSGLPDGAGGLLTTGGSMANLSAIVAARHAGLGEEIAGGTLYVTEHAHASVAKAARIAGLPGRAVRVVPRAGWREVAGRVLSSACMRAVMREVPAHWLDERAHLGHDRWDEVWEGVLHMVPPPSYLHQTIGSKLIAFLSPLLERRGIELRYETGLFRPGADGKDYRVPDLLFFPGEREGDLARAHGIEGAPLAVVEIRSPDDESYEKLPFYAGLGVREVIVVEPIARLVEIYRLAGSTYLAVGADDRGRLHAATIDARFHTVAGPRLRVECDGEVRDI